MSLTTGVRLGHVNLEVSDLRRALAFYDRFLPVLGFRRLPSPPPFQGWVGYRKGRTAIWITVSRPRRARRGPPRVPTSGVTDPISDHLGFEARSQFQVRQLERALRKKGLRPVYRTGAVNMGGGVSYVSCAFQDPDHNVLEVYTLSRR